MTTETRTCTDVQLHPTGAALIYCDELLDENLPGQLNLSNSDLETLRDQLNEAWFVRWGLQPLSLAWSEVQAGDVIPSLGRTLAGSPYPTDTDRTHGTAHFVGGGKLTLPFTSEITVHRRIT